MPLTINLKPRERLIVNGVVIENSGQLAKILIHNNAALLREKDIITEEQATTPARSTSFLVQSFDCGSLSTTLPGPSDATLDATGRKDFS